MDFGTEDSGAEGVVEVQEDQCHPEGLKVCPFAEVAYMLEGFGSVFLDLGNKH